MKAKLLTALPVVLSLAGCVDNYLPEQLDAFDKDAVYTTQVYRPVLGRTTVFSDNFNPGNSTMPLTFTLVNVTKADGSPAPELTQPFPVRVWKTPYLGTETSLADAVRRTRCRSTDCNPSGTKARKCSVFTF